MKFKNRYGDLVEFLELEENIYEFSVKDKQGNPTDYWRFGFEEDPEILTMVDPPGGPYISLGMDLSSYGIKKTVTKIYKENNKIKIKT